MIVDDEPLNIKVARKYLSNVGYSDFVAIHEAADEAFAPLNGRPVYIRDGASRLQTYLRQLPTYADVVVTAADLTIFSGNAETATTDQWNLIQEFRAIVPDSDVKLRAHKLALRHQPDAPSLTLFGVRVTHRVGPFTLQREYATQDDRDTEAPEIAAR